MYLFRQKLYGYKKVIKMLQHSSYCNSDLCLIPAFSKLVLILTLYSGCMYVTTPAIKFVKLRCC